VFDLLIPFQFPAYFSIFQLGVVISRNWGNDLTDDNFDWFILGIPADFIFNQAGNFNKKCT
jgi:hypothetical protein